MINSFIVASYVGVYLNYCYSEINPFGNCNHKAQLLDSDLNYFLHSNLKNLQCALVPKF